MVWYEILYWIALIVACLALICLGVSEIASTIKSDNDIVLVTVCCKKCNECLKRKEEGEIKTNAEIKNKNVQASEPDIEA